MSEFFRRVEKKYILNKEQYDGLKEDIKLYMKEDSHGKSKICNIYLDSSNYELIRNSIEQPVYKDKVRIRSYNTPDLDTNVFIEIKRKSDGVVSKRRLESSLKSIKQFLKSKELSEIQENDRQVLKELKYYFDLYDLRPTAYVSYDRRAYYAKEDDNFRITIDTNIIARNNDLELEKGSYGTQILDKNIYLLETKTLGSLPLWFVKLLSKYDIKPGRFSKYGELYKKLILKINVA